MSEQNERHKGQATAPDGRLKVNIALPMPKMKAYGVVRDQHGNIVRQTPEDLAQPGAK